VILYQEQIIEIRDLRRGDDSTAADVFLRAMPLHPQPGRGWHRWKELQSNGCLGNGFRARWLITIRRSPWLSPGWLLPLATPPLSQQSYDRLAEAQPRRASSVCGLLKPADWALPPERAGEDLKRHGLTLLPVDVTCSRAAATRATPATRANFPPVPAHARLGASAKNTGPAHEPNDPKSHLSAALLLHRTSSSPARPTIQRIEPVNPACLRR